MNKPVATRWHPLKMLQLSATICVAMPVALGLIGTLLLIRALESPAALWREYAADKIQGPWRPLKIGLRIIGAFIAIVFAFPFVVVVTICTVLRSPSGALRDLRRQRERRREWDRLRAQGRVLSWDEAKVRVSSGNGTFVVQMSDAGDLDWIWWIREKRESIDPNGRMPSVTDEQYKPFLDDDRRLLEAAASSASWVEDDHATSDAELLNAIGALPNFELQRPEFEAIALGRSPSAI